MESGHGIVELRVALRVVAVVWVGVAWTPGDHGGTLCLDAMRGWFPGKYFYEVAIKDDGICRVGWSSIAARMDLGTDTHVRCCLVVVSGGYRVTDSGVCALPFRVGRATGMVEPRKRRTIAASTTTATSLARAT